jgi:hypothetical protein
LVSKAQVMALTAGDSWLEKGANLYADTLVPARQVASDMLALERKLSDLVNAALRSYAISAADQLWFLGNAARTAVTKPPASSL